LIDRKENEELLYGFLIAFSASKFHIDHDEVYIPFVEGALSKDTPNHLKYACFKVLETIPDRTPKFQESTFETLLPAMFEQIQEIDDINVAQACISFLRAYVEKWFMLPEEIALEIFKNVIELIGSNDDTTKLSLLYRVLIELLVKAKLRKYDLTASIDITDYMRSTEDITLFSVQILFFSNGLNPGNAEKYIEHTNELFELTNQLIESEDTPLSVTQDLSKAQCLMIPFVGDSFGQYATQIIEESLSVIENQPRVIVESISEQFITSGYYFVPNSPPGTRCYVEETTIDIYNTALLKISRAARILKGDFGEFSEVALNHIIELVSQEIFIEPIHQYAVECIDYIFAALKDNPQCFLRDFQTIVPCIAGELQKPYKECLKLNNMVFSLINILRDMTKENTGIIGVIAGPLVSLLEPLALEKIALETSAKKVYSRQEESNQCDERDYEIVHFTINLSTLADIFYLLSKIIPGQVVEFMKENIIPRTIELIEDKLLKKSELAFLSSFICAAKDEEIFNEFKGFLYEVLTNIEEIEKDYEEAEENEEDEENLFYAKYESVSDVFTTVLEWLIRLVFHCNFSPETMKEMFNIVFNLFQSNFIEDCTFSLTKNCVNILLNMMILKFPGIADDQETENYIIQHTSSLSEIHTYQRFVIFGSVHYLSSLDDEFYQTEEGIDLFKSTIANVFIIFGREHKMEYINHLTKEVSNLITQRPVLRPIFQSLINDINQGRFSENISQPIASGINLFLATRRRLIQEVKQQQKQEQPE
jgi:hypothetical protein